MSEQGSTQDHLAAVSRPSAELRTTQDGAAQPVRMLVLAAVCLGVAAMAAAAFVLSYAGIHDVAIQAGISSQHARDYPVLIDAMLVITLLAVLGLRGAGLPSRILSWLALLCVLAAAAGADVLHATGRMLRHTVGAATAAALPWALVFIAFVLLLALLRHARLRRQPSVARRWSDPLVPEAAPADTDRPVAAPAAPSLPVRTPRAWDSASIVPGFSARLVSSAAAGAAAAAAEEPDTALDAGGHGAGDADPDQDDTMLGLAGSDDSDTRVGAGSADGDPGAAEADATPADADADATPADANATPADANATLTDAPTELANRAEEAAAAEPAGADTTAADPSAKPASAAAESDEPAEADSDADAMPADNGYAETVPPQDAADDPEDSEPPDADQDAADDPEDSEPPDADQDADDDVPDNMPVFHRMWSTPTPPDS